MSVSSSIQACLEFASAALISSGFATESRGGRFPRMIVKFAALVARAPREAVGLCVETNDGVA